MSCTPDQINEERWVGHMAHPAKKNTHTLQVGKQEGLLRGPRHRWENIKPDLMQLDQCIFTQDRDQLQLPEKCLV